MELRIGGRVALVLGASSGLDEAVAYEPARASASVAQTIAVDGGYIASLF